MKNLKHLIRTEVRKAFNQPKEKEMDWSKLVYDDQGYGGKYDLVKKNPFDIQKLVNAKVIYVSKPGDGKGGVAEPNWEGDVSIITLKNLEKPDKWMKDSIKHPMPQAINYVQSNQEQLFYNGKYNQILWSINKKGHKPEEFYLS